jgi:methionine biosynthesis protein MetW
MNVTQFENKRWEGMDQPPEFRHRTTVGLIEGGSVLDLGCGDGLLFGLLGKKIDSGVGLDISPEAVRKCIEKGFDARLHSFDDPLPFPDDTFDYVVLLDVLEHVYDPVPLLAEALRVSKGFVIVGVPNFSSLPARLQVLRGTVPENNSPQKGHIYWFNYPVIHMVVKKAGGAFSDMRMNTFGLARLFGNLPIRFFPNLFALSFVALLKKQPAEGRV